jgi:hypothetical protein
LGNQDSRQALGLLITLVGTGLLSGVYTLNDHFLTSPSARFHQPTPKQQCYYVGLNCTLLNVLVIVLFSLPSIAELQLNSVSVWVVYGLLILSSLGHSLAYFNLLKSTGAVSTAVLQSLRAVLVFALSHSFFCSTDEAQCFTNGKWISTFCVVLGVLAYAYTQTQSSAAEAEFKILYDIDDDQDFLTR